MNKLILAVCILAAIVIAAVVFYFVSQPSGPYHVHVDFKVILGGKEVDFNKPDFMEPIGAGLDENVHMHDFVPSVIHFHSRDASLKDFFKSLKMDFNSDCFFDGNENYCTNSGESLQFYVNSASNNSFGDYRPNDLDKLLIFYGAGTPSPAEFNSITNLACAYSLKCPAPPGLDVKESSCSGQNYCKLS